MTTLAPPSPAEPPCSCVASPPAPPSLPSVTWCVCTPEYPSCWVNADMADGRCYKSVDSWEYDTQNCHFNFIACTVDAFSLAPPAPPFPPGARPPRPPLSPSPPPPSPLLPAKGVDLSTEVCETPLPGLEAGTFDAGRWGFELSFELTLFDDRDSSWPTILYVYSYSYGDWNTDDVCRGPGTVFLATAAYYSSATARRTQTPLKASKPTHRCRSACPRR